jgi:hypothetical protein
MIGNLMSRSKGYEREIASILEDYCHFLDLIHMLLGGKPELYGTRIRADIYPFQVACAIRELMVSRTESCEAAAFLIRSLLEVWIRRNLFRNDLNTSIQYIPKKSLDVPIILKCCKRNGVKFTYSYELLNLVWENLNLVVHFRFKLNSATLWYMFWIANNTHLVSPDGLESLKPKIQQTLENLATAGYVEALHTKRLSQ